METYHVVLTASASVHQSRWIEAKSADEAVAEALRSSGDHEWEYDGVDEHTLEVVAADRQPNETPGVSDESHASA